MDGQGWRKRKAAFEKRLRATGLWARFVAERERLKQRGHDPAVAWEVLMERYEPAVQARERQA